MYLHEGPLHGPPPQRLYTDEEAIDIIGMGMWRLQGTVDAVIEELVAQIEGAMRCMVDEDSFQITPPEQVGIKNHKMHDACNDALRVRHVACLVL